MTDMQNLSALERARMVAAKITGQLPDGMPTKRPADSSSDDNSSKKFASVNDAVGANLALLKSQNIINEDYKVPDKSVGLIIGRGGETLHRIVAETQCKLNIAHDSGGQPERTVTLQGTKESIERAKRAIDDVLRRTPGHGPAGGDGGGGGYHQNGNRNYEMFEMKLPGNKCGLVIGKGGETIKRLSEQYGVKLVVVQETGVPPGSDKPLRITGDPDKVAQAKEAVMALIAPRERGEYGGERREGGGGGGGRHSDRHGGSEVLIKVPGDKAGIVIGKGGESIKDINRRSGAHVEIDKNQRSADGNDKMFIIRGTPEQIQLAQQLIYEKITGVQGSQIPSGYFNQNDMAMNAYGGQRSGSAGPSGAGYGGAGAYGAAGAYGSAAAYNQQQWYGQGAADPNMSAAWQAYYSQYYQPGMQPAGGAAAGGAAPTAMPAPSNGSTGAGASAGGGAGANGAAPGAGQGPSGVQPTINPQTGQPDYSQAWIEYYRSLGMHEQAEAILRQTQQPSQLI